MTLYPSHNICHSPPIHSFRKKQRGGKLYPVNIEKYQSRYTGTDSPTPSFILYTSSHMPKLYIPTIVGTTRPKRQSIHAARLVYNQAKQHSEIDSELLDPNDFHLPYDGNDDENKDPRYTEITSRADAFIIVAPEYNHAYPGSLKRLIDSELQNYNHKPVMLAGVSASGWGGTRVIEALVPVVRELGMVVTHMDINFSTVQNVFDSEGNLLDSNYIGRIDRALEELIWMAKTLRWGRENL